MDALESYTIIYMSTVDELQAVLTGALLRGELAPGDRLRQDDLAARFGVSKIPVREALQRMAGLGLLRFESNRGAVVPRLDVAGAEEIFELRRALEPPLLGRAVERLSIVDLAEAELGLTATASPTEANWAFHRALYRAAGWDRGLATVELLHVAVAPYVLLYEEDLGGQAHSDAEHHELLAACRAGDAARAERVLLVHLDRAAAALTAFLGGAGGP
ncbi:MAG: GntR family transcriptional regulator [Actinobacteria bacterium]|nr:GntR family transcriptional regulator [Actinomycetota bacterium]